MLDTYLTTVISRMQAVAAQHAAIDAAAQHLADAIAADRTVHVIGTGGHSVLGAEEIFFRAGGLACINAILDEGFMLGHGALRSMLIERTPGYATAVLKANDVQRGDCLIIVNAYGINAATIDSALYCRAQGVVSIAVTSVELQTALPPDHPARHPSRQNLSDLCDVVLDCKVPMGDALIDLPGHPERAGACSTFLNATALNLTMLRTIEVLLERNVDVPIFRSANSPGGDEANALNLEKYRKRVRKL